MARLSTIRKLPAELRDLIADKREAGFTISEITDALNALGGDVSRSAVGRYVQNYDDVREELRMSADIGRLLLDPDRDGSQIAEVNEQLLQALIFRITRAGRAGNDLKIGAKDAALLARSLKDLATARKAQNETDLKVRAAQADGAPQDAAPAEPMVDLPDHGRA